jgi:hypothetical protein
MCYSLPDDKAGSFADLSVDLMAVVAACKTGPDQTVVLITGPDQTVVVA